MNKSQMNDLSFLEDYAGAGLEDMNGSAVSVPYLAMVQPGTQATLDGIPAGHWRNSATNEDYGETINVVVLDFKRIWVERSKDPNQLTAARYEPDSIKVEMKYPPKGQKGFPTMYNPDTGNEIQEQFMYVLVLPEHPDAGYLLFNPAVGNMKACRSWNSRIRGQLIPDTNKQAPSFAFIWTLGLVMVQNPQKPAEKIARLSIVGRQGIIEQGLLETAIKPKLEMAKREILALTDSSAEAAD